MAFDFPDKLIHICKIILACTLCAVKVDGYFSNNFRTLQGFVQGDGVSCDFFNIALERVIQVVGINTRGTIFQRSHQVIGYSDNLDMIARNQKELETVFQGEEGNARQLDLKVDEQKTKYMLWTPNEILRPQIGEKVNIGEYNFGVVEQFICLDGLVTAKGNISSLAVNRRIIMANKCFYGLNKLKKSKSLPKSAKLTL
jgi:hypothetical protein